MVDWVKSYLRRRDKLDAEIRKYPNHSFPVALGLRMHRMDVEWWSHGITDSVKKRAFQAAANKLIAGKTFKTGMDVPRGLEVERVFYMVVHGYTSDQYAQHAASYD